MPFADVRGSTPGPGRSRALWGPGLTLYTPHKDVGQAAPEICVGVMSVSIYLVAFLPWGVLAPLNLFKLMLNTVSPYAHVWVPKETEQCQAACGIARMWVRPPEERTCAAKRAHALTVRSLAASQATLFWSLQFTSVRLLHLGGRRWRTLLTGHACASGTLVRLRALQSGADGAGVHGHRL